MSYLVVIEQGDESFGAYVPDLPGCASQGETHDEAVANVREAISACLEAREANGMPLTVAIREVEVAV